MEQGKQKVIVYVDGFNFYYGLKSKSWRKYYWLDMVKFAEKLLRPHQELVEVRYFSAKPIGYEKAKRQDTFLQANKLNHKFIIHLGSYLSKQITCKFCNNIITSFEEKETDVRIATSMLADVYQKRCDITMLISADSDLVPPIERIKELDKKHKVIVCFPPDRHSSNLRKWSNGVKILSGLRLYEECLLPETVTLPNGFVLMRPDKWK
ncbi:MAG: NYN domain-containing protein [Bacteroidales bacterium]|nr:NYN domain-containing protein [Bacteroidales bacterium]